jgi:hypothetical protein
MINAHQAYNLYMTTKKHFTNKPIRVPKSRFLYRPERYRMERLVNRFNTAKDLVQYFVANFALDTPNFLYEPEEYGDISYARWESYKQSLSYNFRNEIDFVNDNIQSFTVDAIMPIYLSGKLSIQAIIMLDSVYNFLTSWEESSSMNVLYESHLQRIKKTKPFVKFDKDTITNLARGLEVPNYEQV